MTLPVSDPMVHPGGRGSVVQGCMMSLPVSGPMVQPPVGTSAVGTPPKVGKPPAGRHPLEVCTPPVGKPPHPEVGTPPY